MGDRTEIVTVSVDDREGMERMVERISEEGGKAPRFVMLSDPDHAVIDRYGLFNEGSPPKRPFPHPATYVIDMKGVVRYRFVETDYRVRPSNEEILAVLKGLVEKGDDSEGDPEGT